MEDTNSSSESSYNSKNENFSWATESGNDLVKYSYLHYPFYKWKKILQINYSSKNSDEGKIYQQNIYKILKEDIFKDEEFVNEEDYSNYFKEFIDNDKTIDITMKPDFLIKNISIKKFKNVLKNNKYMFRTSSNFCIPSEYDKITIIGEIKINPEEIQKKQKQKNKYINYRNYVNKTNKKIFFIVMYIFDYSYKKFWGINFFEGDNLIISYIPKLYKSQHLEIYEKLKENENRIFENDLNTASDFSSNINNKTKEISISQNNRNEIVQIMDNSSKEIKILDIGKNSLIEKKDEFEKMINDKKEKIFSFIDIGENVKENKIKEINRENEELKMKFIDAIESINNEKKRIEDIRELQDEITMKKRKKEDEEFFLRSKKQLDDFEMIFKQIAELRQKDNSNEE